MNVGIFAQEILPQAGGGYTMQGDLLQWLVKLAGESRHQFSVFTRQPETLAETLQGSPVGTIRFPGGIAERLFSKARRGIPAHGKQRKSQTRFDEVARARGLDFIWFLGAEAMQVDIPYLAVVWDLQHRLQPWFPEVSAHGQWIHREKFYSEFLRRASFIIAGTQAGSNEIQRFYQVPASTIKILKHPTPGFVLSASEAKPGEDAGLLKRFGLTRGYLLYPAQLWPHKNHANLFHALRLLKERHGLILQLALVGSDKGNTEYLRRLATELDLVAQVLFVGFVSEEELVALYRNAFALTYVSYFGPENLPPLEAFALGCPVIAANVDGAEEQFGESAIRVDPKSPEEIAQAIKSLHENEQLRDRLVNEGRARAQSWTGEHFVKGVFSILDSFENIRRCWHR